MARCTICGKKIQPYCEVCAHCFSITQHNNPVISIHDFAQQMGINIFEG